MKRAAFLDRDGVINIDHAYVHDREHFEWVPGVLEGARMLTDAGFLLVVVTNQSGIGRGYYTEADFHALTDWMCGVFAEAGAPIALFVSARTTRKRHWASTGVNAAAANLSPE